MSSKKALKPTIKRELMGYLIAKIWHEHLPGMQEVITE
ncbi:hypothetical protein KKH3_12280 [Pectobacterium actinidiae]|nr:hypothetical protein KKH3_12280 [Pectobacterium actinidiae]